MGGDKVDGRRGCLKNCGQTRIEEGRKKDVLNLSKSE